MLHPSMSAWQIYELASNKLVRVPWLFDVLVQEYQVYDTLGLDYELYVVVAIGMVDVKLSVKLEESEKIPGVASTSRDNKRSD